MLWVTAERQAAGRGRRGRTWVSERGNLYATLLLVDPATDRNLLNLPLVVALGVRNGIAGLPGIDPTSVRIKWPNDILIAGAKSVGILLESEMLADGRRAVVIGCGINVERLPDERPAYPVTRLRDVGVSETLPTIFDHFAQGVELALEKWSRGLHFDEVRADWMMHAVGLGRPGLVNLADRSVSGVFRDLDRDGRLVLELENGSCQTFSAGELFFPSSPV